MNEGVAQSGQELQAQVALVREKEIEVSRLKAQLESLQALNSEADDDMSVMIPAAYVASSRLLDAEVDGEVDGQVDGEIIDSELDLSSGPSAAEAEQIASLEARIESLELELSESKQEAETASAQTGVRDEMEELVKRLRQKAQDFDRLSRQMDGEKRKVSELERERELQNKSLQVLHQQLEMERNRTVAPASVS